MNPEWKTFLTTQGAGVEAEEPVKFAAAAPFPPCSLHELSHLGLISVVGEDRVPFLQGQLTNDIRQLSPTHSQLAAYCTPKGRMLTILRLIDTGEQLLLQLPRELLPSVLRRLGMFVIRSRVGLRDASDDWVRMGLAGDCARERLAASFAELPTEPNGVSRQGDVLLLRHPGPTPRYEILGPVGDLLSLWRRFAAQAVPSNAAHWAWFDIRAGIPNLLAQNVEAFVPQMTNLQLVDGVSFTKGCYAGQEVVARMQYLGKLKRRMYLAHVDGEKAPQAGDELFSPLSDSGQGAGRVVEAQAAPGGGYDLLVVAEIAGVDADQLFLSEVGAKLSWLSLPYELSASSN